MVTAECAQALASPVMQQIVRVESAGNPFAIGVVGDRLLRQPQNLDEAVATATQLLQRGFNFSIGKGQINRLHFQRLGWTGDLALGFDVCRNMTAAVQIFADCQARAIRAGYLDAAHPADPSAGDAGSKKDDASVHAALSCYYSGDFERGARLGYVAKVLRKEASVPEHARRGVPARHFMSMMLE